MMKIVEERNLFMFSLQTLISFNVTCATTRCERYLSLFGVENEENILLAFQYGRVIV